VSPAEQGNCLECTQGALLHSFGALGVLRRLISKLDEYSRHVGKIIRGARETITKWEVRPLETSSLTQTGVYQSGPARGGRNNAPGSNTSFATRANPLECELTHLPRKESLNLLE
jgi:hypothetical protein